LVKASPLVLGLGATAIIPGKAEAQTMFGRFGYSAGAYYSQTTGDDPQKEIVAKSSGFTAFHVGGKKFTVGPYFTLNFALNSEENTRIDVTDRDRTLIGPGTYKYRTDELTTRTEIEPIAGTGMELGYNAWGRLETNLSAGVVKYRTIKNISGESIITIERNGEVLASEPINGALSPKRETSFKTEIDFGLGARLYAWGKGKRLYGHDPYLNSFVGRRNGEWRFGIGLGVLN